MAENTLLRAVKIVHLPLHGAEYRLLADFFRLIGCFVSECTLKEEPLDEFDLTIVVGEEFFNNEEKERLKRFPNQNRMIYMDLMNQDENRRYTLDSESCDQYLQNCLEKIKANRTEWNELATVLKQIASIYVENELMKSRCLASYLNEEPEIVQAAQMKYAKAFRQVKDLSDKTGQKSPYVEYARIDLARMLNETNSFLDERFLFNTEKLLEYAGVLARSFPDFYNLFMYQGLLAELDRYTADEANKYYQKALDKIGGREYAVYANYRMGRFYEKRRKNPEKALEYYTEANRLNPHNYRTLYKLGMYYRGNKNYTQSIYYFSQIVTELSYKKISNYMQQKEYEYLYKTYCMLGSVYESMENYREAIEQYEDAIKIIEMLDRADNGWYQEVFGDDAGRYLETVKKRWPLDVVWERLMRIYMILGNRDKAQKYHDKLINSGEWE